MQGKSFDFRQQSVYYETFTIGTKIKNIYTLQSNKSNSIDNFNIISQRVQFVTNQYGLLLTEQVKVWAAFINPAGTD